MRELKLEELDLIAGGVEADPGDGLPDHRWPPPPGFLAPPEPPPPTE